MSVTLLVQHHDVTPQLILHVNLISYIIHLLCQISMIKVFQISFSVDQDCLTFL